MMSKHPVSSSGRVLVWVMGLGNATLGFGGATSGFGNATFGLA
jgi:hypothetical protein